MLGEFKCWWISNLELKQVWFSKDKLKKKKFPSKNPTNRLKLFITYAPPKICQIAQSWSLESKREHRKDFLPFGQNCLD